MNETTSDAPPLPSLPSRAIGVIVSPQKTFAAVVAKPKVFGALALVTLIALVLSVGFMASQRGHDAFFDLMYDRIQQGNPTAQQLAQAQQGIDRLQTMADDHPVGFLIWISVGNLVSLPLGMVIVGGLLFVAFNVVLGGTASFKQVMAVVAHTGFVLSLQQIVTVPLNLARGSMTSATTFAVLFPMIEEGTFLGRLLGSFDLFILWATIVLAIGLGVLYRRSGRATGVWLLGFYAAIAVLIAYFRSR